jgi:CDGSH-type Zn-finger protein
MNERLVAQKGPYAIDVEPGKKYWWCACGRSQKQPFCDGSHKGTGLSPLPFTATEGQRLWFCGCKRTGREPLCDGTHERL